MSNLDLRMAALKLAAKGQDDPKAIIDAAAKFYGFLTGSDMDSAQARTR